MMILLMYLIWPVARLVKDERTYVVILMRWLIPGIFAKSRALTQTGSIRNLAIDATTGLNVEAMYNW